MTAKRKQFIVVSLVVLASVGFIWFCIFGGGYHVELWLGRFDQSVWLENKTEGRHSPRRPMVKSLMRHLTPGMTRQQVETLLGPASYQVHADWQTYDVGHPRWDPFALDHDVFEVRYEQERLVEMRFRNT